MSKLYRRSALYRQMWLSFSRPTFGDPELNRQASLLHAFLQPILIITLLFGLVALILRSPLIFVALAMLGVEALVFQLLCKGKVQAGSMLLICTGWLVTLLPAFFQQNGLSSPFLLFTLFWLVAGGLLVGINFMLALLVANIAAISVLLVSTFYSILPQWSLPALGSTPIISPLKTWLLIILVLSMAAALLRLAITSLRQGLENARLAQVELIQNNAELRAAREALEARVVERTAGLERRARELQASAEVVRAIASIRDLEALLVEITHTISQQFGCYHCGVFLLAGNGEERAAGNQLVLRAASSQSGQSLVQAGFSIPLEQTSIVTTTVRTGKPYLASDVSKDLLYLPLDVFPATRSELALPLLTGERIQDASAEQSGPSVLGVLDLQSASTAAFSQPDLAILQSLANQVAIAIENARLFNENRQALESLQRVYASLSQEGWQKLLRTQPNLSYRAGSPGRPTDGSPAIASSTSGAGQDISRMAATPVWPSTDSAAARALQRGQVVQPDPATLAVPIKIRDQATGVIRLRKPLEAGPWTPDEIDLVEILSDRLSTALESARLYEETRRRAERERLTGEITARMRATNDPQAILQTAAQELRKALQAGKARLTVQSVPAGMLQPQAAAPVEPAAPVGIGGSEDPGGPANPASQPDQPTDRSDSPSEPAVAQERPSAQGESV